MTELRAFGTDSTTLELFSRLRSVLQLMAKPEDFNLSRGTTEVYDANHEFANEAAAAQPQVYGSSLKHLLWHKQSLLKHNPSSLLVIDCFLC